MYLNGEKVVENDGCHGELEKGSSDKYLVAGPHEIVVDMCETKLHFSIPLSPN